MPWTKHEAIHQEILATNDLEIKTARNALKFDYDDPGMNELARQTLVRALNEKLERIETHLAAYPGAQPLVHGANEVRREIDALTARYEVGNCKPPKQFWFQKGNPGGPGRPKGSASIKQRLLDALTKNNGKNLDRVVDKLIKSAIKGDLRSIALVAKLTKDATSH